MRASIGGRVKKASGPYPYGTLDYDQGSKSAMPLQLPLLRVCAVAAATAGLLACTSVPLPPPAPYPSQPPPPASVTPLPLQPPPPAAAPVPEPRPQSAFIRPAQGPIVGRFDGQRNKGIDFAGQLGDPIVAAADGRVVYVGGELRGYGNMVIVQHPDDYLTAYAHADRILVKEKDVVRQGQPIAEMGRSGTDRVKLRFEIRKQGTAVDPEPYLGGPLP